MLTQQSLLALREAIVGCQGCNLGVSCRPEFLPTPSSGPVDAPIAIIGRSPGQEEARLGAPHLGPSGLLLRQFLELAGVDVEKCYLTNLALCHSYDRSPTQDEYEACQQWKRLEFTAVKPKLVILLGDEVYRFFYPSKLDSTAKAHGMAYDGFERQGYGAGFKVLILPAPSFVLSRRAHLPAIWGGDATVLRVLCRQLGIGQAQGQDI